MFCQKWKTISSVVILTIIKVSSITRFLTKVSNVNAWKKHFYAPRIQKRAWKISCFDVVDLDSRLRLNCLRLKLLRIIRVRFNPWFMAVEIARGVNLSLIAISVENVTVNRGWLHVHPLTTIGSSYIVWLYSKIVFRLAKYTESSICIFCIYIFLYITDIRNKICNCRDLTT